MDAMHLDARHRLQFRSLRLDGEGLAFPCDADGRVEIDLLDDQARNAYFYARTLIGREFLSPAIELISRDRTFPFPA